MKHYSLLTSEVDEDEIHELLQRAMVEFDKFVYVLDLVDFDGTFRPEILSPIKNCDVTFVANKFDALPRTLGVQELNAWLRERIASLFGNVPSQLFVTSAKNGYGVSKLKSHLESKTGKALILGVTNVGKSSLLKFIANSEVTVSPFPGTTIGLVQHTVGKLRLYDAPGIIMGDRLVDLLDPACQARIYANGNLTRKTFKPSANEVIFVGGLMQLKARMKDHGHPNSELRPIFQIFAPERVTFHKTQNWAFIEGYDRHFGKLLVPPCGRLDLGLLRLKSVQLTADEDHEISVLGLCWINVKRGPVSFELTLPESVGVSVRPSLMKPKRRSK